MNPRPKQISSRDNAGNIVDGKFLKSTNGITDYDVLLDSDLSSKLIKRGQHTLIALFQDGSNEGRPVAEGIDTLIAFTNNNVTTTSGASGTALLASTSGTFIRASTMATSTQVAGWSRSGSPAFAVGSGLRVISKFGIGVTGFTTFANFGWGLATDSSLLDAVANPPTSGFIGVQLLAARDTNYQFVCSNGATQTVVDSGILPTGVTQYLEMEIASDASSVRFILRDGNFIVVSDETITTNIPATFVALYPIGSVQTTAAIVRQFDTFFFLVDNLK